jgi:hypothetical protein
MIITARMDTEPTTKREQHLAEAARLGAAAFHRGVKCAPALDLRFLPLLKAQPGVGAERCATAVECMEAWLAAWHEANLAAPIYPLASDIPCEAYAKGPVAQRLAPFGFYVEHNGAGPVLERQEKGGGLTTVGGAARDGCGAHNLAEGIHVYRQGADGESHGPEEYESLGAYTSKLEEDIFAWMRAHRAEHVDKETGDLDLTALVEAWDEACSTGEATEDEHHVAWELAVEVYDEPAEEDVGYEPAGAVL